MEEQKRKQEILKKQMEIYQGDRGREENNGNIKCIDLSELSDEELQKLIFHYSLKKDKTSIDKNGLKSAIGRNSKGIDKLKAIYFSYGLEAVLETWDVWLKWRTDHLYNPYWQEENQELLEAMKNGTATEQEMQKYWYKCQLWNEEFTSGKYKDDKEKMDFLFEFQTDEMLASNYYLLDLKEGEDFSFDEIDVKKARTLTQDKNGTSYKKFKEMYGEYSDLESDKVDKWNMNTFLGQPITITPDRIKELTLPNGKNDVLSIVEFLYDRYKEITPQEQQVQFDLLDKYMEYVKEKIRNNELQEFNRNTRIDEIEYISYFHDQKTDTYFQDSQAGIYSIFEQQIGKATINTPTKIKDKAENQVQRDEQTLQQDYELSEND